MSVIQLDLFREDDVSTLEVKVLNIQEKLDRQRRSQFAKIGELKKTVVDLEERLIIIERAICTSKIL